MNHNYAGIYNNIDHNEKLYIVQYLWKLYFIHPYYAHTTSPPPIEILYLSFRNLILILNARNNKIKQQNIRYYRTWSRDHTIDLPMPPHFLLIYEYNVLFMKKIHKRNKQINYRMNQNYAEIHNNIDQHT